MKLKQSPDDFRVEELTDVTPTVRGAFAFYRLEKRNRTTPDALDVIRRRWRVDSRRISCAGLKDRHANTTQYLSIFRGPRRDLRQEGLRVTYLGQVEREYTSGDIRANRFGVVVRHLTDEQAERALIALEEVRREGLPNYFDDQRFGSVGRDGEFIGRLLVRGDFEGALKLALTGPYEFDRPAQKREKETIRSHWGDWAACQERLGRGEAGRLIGHLVARPTDFRGALERLRPELRALYLSAYQSDLWNRTLALYLRRSFPDRLAEVPTRRGTLPFHHGLTDEQRRELEALSLPLASARMKLAADDPRGEFVRAVLAEEGLTPEQMKVRGSRDLFFSKGERPALCMPSNLEGHTDADDRHEGRRKLTLRFDLPRGSYATLLVKRVF